MEENILLQLNNCIKRISHNDKSGLEGIYNLLGARMLTVAKGYMKNVSDAEDAISETFLKIVRYASDFDGKNAYGWIIKILSNTCLNMLRSSGRKTTNIDDELNLTKGDETESNTTKIAVKNALNELPKTERYIIYCKYFLDKTVREIAKETGISKSSVQRMIESAENKLKNILT